MPRMQPGVETVHSARLGQYYARPSCPNVGKMDPAQVGPYNCLQGRRKHLLDLFIPYETRKALLQYLSAYDVARLDLSLNHILDDYERELYLDPARDLIWNLGEAKSLMQDGIEARHPNLRKLPSDLPIVCDITIVRFPD